MACPYFIPTEPYERELWSHRHRLPLGDGFAGCCGARASETPCEEDALRQHCNLGYATCEHLPVERPFDVVRFLIQKQSSGMLRVQFACELAHLPALSGELSYDQSSMCWAEPPASSLLHLADAAVQAWISRNAIGVAH